MGVGGWVWVCVKTGGRIAVVSGAVGEVICTCSYPAFPMVKGHGCFQTQTLTHREETLNVTVYAPTLEYEPTSDCDTHPVF